MGVMFAQSTGLPLKGAGTSNETAAKYDTFYEGLIGRGDILEDYDYRQILFIGSDADFGGRKSFFTTHGDFEIRDYGYAVECGLIPEDYHVF